MQVNNVTLASGYWDEIKELEDDLNNCPLNHFDRIDLENRLDFLIGEYFTYASIDFYLNEAENN